MTKPDEKSPLVDDVDDGADDGKVPGEWVMFEQQEEIHSCCRHSIAPGAEKAILVLGVFIMLEILIVLSAYTGGVLARLVHELFG